ncbi:hypothetical protein LPPLD21_01243 [Lactiplantibacillus paraplantarum]|uniref:Uncharacterized protein n=1 Tax=Lactiplantibacillus paraplantarum TaxID=60520 RepID=A0ABQ0N9J6_9LACO|nr:hypothetical protein LPPLD21_01243 [Lactiplantibacillus paraplantarum]
MKIKSTLENAGGGYKLSIINVSNPFIILEWWCDL